MIAALETIFASTTTWIFFGVAAQLALLFYLRGPHPRFAALPAGVMVVGLLAAIPTALDGEAYAYHIGMGLGLFFAAALLALEYPAALGVGASVSVTATYWLSLWLSPEGQGAFTVMTAIFLGGPATLGLLWLVAFRARPDGFSRFMLLVWTIFAAVVVGVVRFPISDVAPAGVPVSGWTAILAATYYGAHLCLVGHNAISLAALFPIHKNHDIERYARKLLDAYSPEALTPARAAAIVAAQAVLVSVLNLWRPQGAWIAAHASLSICLLASAFFSGRRAGAMPLPTGGDIKREMRRRREQTERDHKP